METMNSTEPTPRQWNALLFRRTDVSISIFLCIVLALLLPTLLAVRKPSRKLPFVNAPSLLDFFARGPKERFLFNARKMLENARTQLPGQPYRFMTDTGITVVIPSDYLHAIRNEPGLSFQEAFSNNFHPQLPGFEGFREGARPDQLFQIVIKKHITKLLSRFRACC